MTYAILYRENGDFVADYGSKHEAEAAMRAFVAEFPDTVDHVGLMPFDEAGMPAGEFVPGTSYATEHVA